MAPVEAIVVNSMPFALTRLWFTKHNKAGQFPSAKFAAVHYMKTRPNRIQMKVFAEENAFPQVKAASSGQFSMTLRGTSTFDHVALGRMLVKAALGGMALEKGRDYVLEPRFNAARQFVRMGKGLHARLVMARNASPRSEL